MDSDKARSRLAEIALPLETIEASIDMGPLECARNASLLERIATQVEIEILPSVRGSKDGDLRDEAARVFRRLAQSNSWLRDREDRTREWIDRASEFATSDVLRDLVVAEQVGLRDSEALQGTYALCQQGLVDKARRILVSRRRRSKDPVLRNRIDELLADPRNLLAPLTSLPGLSTINGVGMMLHGERNARPDGTYVTTLCLVFLFIPILPFKAYLVSREQQGWRFYGRVPLSALAFWWRRIVLIGPLVAALALWGADAWRTNPILQENRHLSKAAEYLSGGNPAMTITELVAVKGSGSGRPARRDELARKALTDALSEVATDAKAQAFLMAVGGMASRLVDVWRDERMIPPLEGAIDRLASQPSPGKAIHPFLTWMEKLSDPVSNRMPALSLRACMKSADASLLAAVTEIHRRASVPVPADILNRLRQSLLERRHESWDADALTYLLATESGDARAVLLARSEAAWKGAAPGTELLGMKTLPEPLRALLTLDAEGDAEKRAAGLEKAREAAGLEEPERTWHRLGSARRLGKAYGELNEKDPIRFPVSRVRSWALLAAELDPKDPETRVTALRYLVEDGDFARVIAMGSAAPEDARSALLVGVAHARSGKPEEAARILRPLVERVLPEFAGGYSEWQKAVAARSESLSRSLQIGTAPGFIIQRLNSLSRDQAILEARAWIQQQLDGDPWISQLAKRWRPHVDVHRAASELAMVELGLGRAMPPGPERQGRLEAAERLFLELRKVLQDDPHQELQLGQVYFWLGKDKEGAEIYSRLEETGDAKILHAIGEIYRGLYRMEASRRVLEKAYKQANDTLKQTIAITRSLASDDEEERLEWLNKCDSSDPGVLSQLDQTQAEVALRKGDFQKAREHLSRAAAYYAKQAETSVTLNNGAVVQMSLALATGDFDFQLAALRLMRRAHELSPEDGIVMGNYLDLLQEVGYASLAGKALRSDLLHEMPGRAWLDYVDPCPTPQEWAEKAKQQPELRRAAELGARAVVLSPNRESGYRVQTRYFSMLQDRDAYRRLRESVESNPPRRDEAKKPAAEPDEAGRKAMSRHVARWDLLMPSIQKAGHAPTLAYALTRSATTRLGAFQMNLPGVTLESAVRQSEEAVAAMDSGPTRTTLAWMRMEQAAHGLASADQEFARWVKQNPKVSPSALVPLYVRKHPDRAAAVGEREDVRRAVLAVADLSRFPSRNRWIQAWAWLDLGGHESRESVRTAIASDPTLLEACRLDLLLDPQSPKETAETWLAATACGEKGLAGKIAASARAAGLLSLFFGE